MNRKNRLYVGNFAPPINQRDTARQSTLSPDLTLLFLLTFFTAVVMMIAISNMPKPRLESHPMCGVTTGGQDECYFDCSNVSCFGVYDVLVQDLSCLSDCFQSEQETCVRSLLNDVLDKGVCNSSSSFLDAPSIYPQSPDCEIFRNETYYAIINGTCSEKTESLLMTEVCLGVIYGQQEFIQDTLTTILGQACSRPVFIYYFIFAIQNNLISRRETKQKYHHMSERITSEERLNPAQSVFEQVNIRTILQYNNTRNRYPWVCSLRSRGASPNHRCAVNLLSIPPNPTVLVGAAHCTYICKDGAREVPTCCCSFDTDACIGINKECGDNPKIVEMTGADSTILCGEWETSMADSIASGERYNIKLPILEIVRHPGFDPAKGPLNGKDIVVFKVDDSNIRQNVTDSLQLWPACLPSQIVEMPMSGIHTGWSEPPPFSFIQSQAQGYAEFYSDFYKQWHYKMDIIPTCEDPKVSALCGGPLQFPSNSSYPAGTVCAKDVTRQSCFSTGDSGSPLMVKTDENSEKLQVEGILSFVKGCSQFEFGLRNDYTQNNSTYILYQETENPTTYTKLSCYLPWVADQYNMEYETTGPLESACNIGSGDPLDSKKQVCRNTPSNQFEYIFDQEFECKFPFYYNGKRYDKCILLVQEDFLYPVFRCPIRDITTKINGINSFESSPLVGGFCLSDPEDENSALDPNQEDCNNFKRRLPFSQCKNNCPGVRAFGIVGGGAVLAGIGTVSVLSSFLPVLGIGAVGAAGVGGSMLIAQTMCAAPFFCNSPSGKCCPVTFSINGIVCPDTC